MKSSSLLLSVVFIFFSSLCFGQEVSGGPTQTAPIIGSGVTAGEMPNALQRMVAEVPSTRVHSLNLVSEAFVENGANPALRLEKMWVNEQGTVLELTGLIRKGKQMSAVIAPNSVFLLDLNNGKKANLLTHVGGQEVVSSDGQKMVGLLPSEKIYLFFETVNDINPVSLRYTSWSGVEDRYFDKIDPLFQQRYDASFLAATSSGASVESMKAFLLEFAANDPSKRAQGVFVELINQLRYQKTFDGHLQAYKLVKDPADEVAAGRLARTEEQRQKLESAVASVRAAEALKRDELNRAREARQNELRKRDEARVAEIRQQEEIKRAEQRKIAQVDAEAQCLKTPSCRRAWEAEQAKCSGQIQACRGGCDRLSGAGGYSSFLSNLVAAGISRTCYIGCKCGSGFDVLLGKVGAILSDSPAPKADSRRESGEAAVSSKANSSTSSSGNQGPATTEILRAHWTDDIQSIFVRCARSGKERHYTFNRKTGRYCTIGYIPSCESEEWVQRAVCH